MFPSFAPLLRFRNQYLLLFHDRANLISSQQGLGQIFLIKEHYTDSFVIEF